MKRTRVKTNRLGKTIAKNGKFHSQALSIATLAGLMMLGAASNDVQAAEKGLQTATTIDTVTTESKAFLNGNHNSYTLDTTAADDKIQVIIDGTNYYFTPNETGADEKETEKLNNELKNLVATGASALKESNENNYIFKLTDANSVTKYYTYDPSKLPQSGYTLTPTEATTGDNLIPKYIWNNDTQTLENDNYTFAASKTTYGEGDTSKYYKWVSGENGNRTLTDATASDADITAKYNDITGKTYGTIYQNLSKDLGTFSNFVLMERTIFNGGSIIKNPENSIISIGSADNRTLFKDNYTKATLKMSSGSWHYPYLNGGMIYNAGEITEINADFKDNIFEPTTQQIGDRINSNIFGGAIYNDGKINKIVGDFINNKIISNAINSKSDSMSAEMYAPTIYNNSENKIDVYGNFTDNQIIQTSSTPVDGGVYQEGYGGAIGGNYGNIEGNFIHNGIYMVENSSLDVNTRGFGGAIYVASESTNGVWKLLGIDNIKGDFINNYVYASSVGDKVYFAHDMQSEGGAIYLYHSYIGNITGDFINNSATTICQRPTGSQMTAYALGGAIYLWNDSHINSITGNFINNYTSTIAKTTSGFIATNNSLYSAGKFGGGAIKNYKSSIESITGDFIGNYSEYESNAKKTRSDYIYMYTYLCGGAICNDKQSTINNITGDFTKNSISVITKDEGTNTRVLTYGEGGAIYNSSDSIIGNIKGNFSQNKVYEKAYKASDNYLYSYADGGAISNYGTIKNIMGDFTDNQLSATGESAESSTYTTYAYGYGGAIYNTSTIGDITGNFINNSINVDATNNRYGYGYGRGGAIYNTGTIGNIINASFIGNNITANAKNGSYLYGAAIYTTNDLNFISDNYNSVYKDNWYKSGTSAIQNEAIYVGNSSATLTFNAKNNGSFTFDDYINGYSGYKLHFTGDGTGAARLNNNANYANIISDAITMDLQNNNIFNYSIYGLNSDESAKWNIDVDLTNGTADKLTISNSTNTTGKVVLNSINFMGESSDLIKTIQILNSPTDAIQLEFGDGIIFVGDIDPDIPIKEQTALITVPDTVNYGDFVATERGITLATTKTQNDSIKIMQDGIYTDLLPILNQKESEVRNYNFTDSDQVYTVNNTLGNTAAGEMHINGVTDEEGNRSTINLNGKGGFFTQNNGTNSKLFISDVTIQNAGYESDSGASGQGVAIRNHVRGAYEDGNVMGSLNNVRIENSSNAGVKVYEGSLFGDISGEFLNNDYGVYVTDSSQAGNISGNFENNNSYGLFISSNSLTGDISGEFIDNRYQDIAIYDSKVGNISGTFRDKTLGNPSIIIYGANTQTGDISGTFSNLAYQGIQASSAATIGNVSATFENNSGSGIYAYNGVKIGDISGTFSNNIGSSSGMSINASNGTMINSISATFKDNQAQSSNAGGIFLYNGANIQDAIKDSVFENNYSKYGGSAIYAQGNGTIITNGIINSIFKGNHADCNSGGAIYIANGANVPNIDGSFEGNYISTEDSNTIYGGAIADMYSDTNYSAQLTTITGNFKDNYLESGNSAYGGAIFYGYQQYKANIKGDFTNNHVSAVNSAEGGAISTLNGGYVSNVIGNFVNNYAKSIDGTAKGGAMSITQGGNNIFIALDSETVTNNYAESENGSAYGGAYNLEYINGGRLSGAFTNNHVTAKNDAMGGALYISSVNSPNVFKNTAFENNYAKSSDGTGSGGAIYTQYGTQNWIYDTSFINNAATTNGGAAYLRYGGTMHIFAENENVLFSGNKVGDIDVAQDGTFSVNNAKSEAVFLDNSSGTLSLHASEGKNITFNDAIRGNGLGATLCINRPETTIYKDFDTETNSYVTGELTQRGGDYIFNNDIENVMIYLFDGAKITLGSYTDEAGNTSYGNLDLAHFQTFNQAGEIDARNNLAQDLVLSRNAATTLNADLLFDVDADLANLHADNLYTANVADIDTAPGKVIISGINILTDANGDGIAEVLVTDERLKDRTELSTNVKISKLDTVKDNYMFTYKEKDDGGYLRSMKVNLVETVRTQLAKEKAYGMSKDENVTEDLNILPSGEDKSTIGNLYGTLLAIDGNGHAIAVTDEKKGTVSGITVTDGQSLGVNNVGKDKNSKTTSKGLNGFTTALTAKENSVIDVNNSLLKDNNTAIQSDENSSITLKDTTVEDNTTGIINQGTLNLFGGNEIKDKISGPLGTINITGNNTIDNTVETSALNLDGGNLKLGQKADFTNTTSFNVANTPTVNTQNKGISNINLGNLVLNSDMNLKIDGSFANKKLDTITVNSINNNGNHINISDISILTPTTDKKFAISPIGQMNSSAVRTELANTIRYTGGDLAMTPIYKYHTSYDQQKGLLLFERFGGGGRHHDNPSENFNPAILTAPVSAQANAQTTMNYGFNYAFEHAYSFTTLPSSIRNSKIHGNEYALSTDYNNNIDLNNEIDLDHTNKAIWVKPYTSFEKINLHNGPKVGMISYGTIIGGDSNFRKLKKGWANVGTAYLGYNGSRMDYDHVDMTSNGGLLGITETFYKKNFYAAITAQAGAGFTEAHTMYGRDDITSLMAGVATKTGYNFEFNDGKFVIQPNLMLNYSMVNTFNYTNAAGVRIKSDPLHTIQINPTLRFIGNLNHGWQPYASVGMVWNVMNNTKVTANNERLPEMSTRPYVEYGVGIQKHIGDTFSGYGQAMVRNGGRNGIALTLGFRWALGGKKAEKVRVQKPNEIKPTSSKKTILKSLQTQYPTYKKVML